jgi:hypothetical protein
MTVSPFRDDAQGRGVPGPPTPQMEGVQVRPGIPEVEGGQVRGSTNLNSPAVSSSAQQRRARTPATPPSSAEGGGAHGDDQQPLSGLTPQRMKTARDRAASLIGSEKGRKPLQDPRPRRVPPKPKVRTQAHKAAALFVELELAQAREAGQAPKSHYADVLSHLTTLGLRHLQDRHDAGVPFPSEEAFSDEMFDYCLRGKRARWYPPRKDADGVRQVGPYPGVDQRTVVSASAEAARFCLVAFNPEVLEWARAWGRQGGLNHRPRGKTFDPGTLLDGIEHLSVAEQVRRTGASKSTVKRVRRFLNQQAVNNVTSAMPAGQEGAVHAEDPVSRTPLAPEASGSAGSNGTDLDPELTSAVSRPPTPPDTADAAPETDPHTGEQAGIDLVAPEPTPAVPTPPTPDPLAEVDSMIAELEAADERDRQARDARVDWREEDLRIRDDIEARHRAEYLRSRPVDAFAAARMKNADTGAPKT